jgi:hypothetical protein
MRQKNKNSKIKITDVRNYLHSQDTYTIYRPARKRFKRLQTVPAGLHNCWQCDLAIFDSISKSNEGI